MRDFFDSTPVKALGLFVTILALAQFAAPYLLAPVPLTFTPVAGAVIGIGVALLIIFSINSTGWTKKKVVPCFFFNAVLFGLNIAFQIFLYIITDAERAETFEFTNKMHGFVVRYFDLLPLIYLIAIAICLYSGMTVLYWLYRWMKA